MSDLRAKNGQNGISSGVGRQDLYAMFTPASDWAATVASERERKI